MLCLQLEIPRLDDCGVLMQEAIHITAMVGMFPVSTDGVKVGEPQDQTGIPGVVGMLVGRPQQGEGIHPSNIAQRFRGLGEGRSAGLALVLALQPNIDMSRDRHLATPFWVEGRSRPGTLGTPAEASPPGLTLRAVAAGWYRRRSA